MSESPNKLPGKVLQEKTDSHKRKSALGSTPTKNFKIFKNIAYNSPSKTIYSKSQDLEQHSDDANHKDTLSKARSSTSSLGAILRPILIRSKSSISTHQSPEPQFNKSIATSSNSKKVSLKEFADTSSESDAMAESLDSIISGYMGQEKKEFVFNEDFENTSSMKSKSINKSDEYNPDSSIIYPDSFLSELSTSGDLLRHNTSEKRSNTTNNKQHENNLNNTNLNMQAETMGEFSNVVPPAKEYPSPSLVKGNKTINSQNLSANRYSIKTYYSDETVLHHTAQRSSLRSQEADETALNKHQGYSGYNIGRIKDKKNEAQFARDEAAVISRSSDEIGEISFDYRSILQDSSHLTFDGVLGTAMVASKSFKPLKSPYTSHPKPHMFPSIQDEDITPYEKFGIQRSSPYCTPPASIKKGKDSLSGNNTLNSMLNPPDESYTLSQNLDEKELYHYSTQHSSSRWLVFFTFMVSGLVAPPIYFLLAFGFFDGARALKSHGHFYKDYPNIPIDNLRKRKFSKMQKIISLLWGLLWILIVFLMIGLSIGLSID